MRVLRRGTIAVGMVVFSRIAFLALACLPWAAMAQSGTIGEKAPPIKVGQWVKGTAIDWKAAAAEKKVYLVEFWATWCRPCLASIPHLSKLQKELGPKGLVIIGVSNEADKTVSRFVNARGDEMAYHVAVDDAEKSTTRNYLEAFGLNGIPHAFLIDREGRLVWHGSPFDPRFDEIVLNVLDGKHDFGPFKEADALRLKRLKIQPLAEEYFNAVVENASTESINAIAQRFLEAAKGDGPFLDQFAVIILDHPSLPRRDTALALKAATLAHEILGEAYPDHLEIFAKAWARNENYAKAVEMQKKAIALAKEPGDLARMNASLVEYERRLNSDNP